MLSGLTVGLCAGCGLVLLAAGFRPRPPALASALDALYRRHDDKDQLDLALTIPGARHTTSRVVARVLRHPTVADLMRGLTPDLAILEQSRADYVAAALARIGISTGIGLLASVTVSPLPFVLPVGVGVVFGLVLVVQQYTDVRSRARKRREELVDGLSAFVDFVKLGITFRPLEGALFAAARSGTGWLFPMLTAAMEDATRAKASPVAGLELLGQQIAAPELEDLGASLSYAGTDGAKIRESLGSRARSLRERSRARAVAQANAASERIVLPVCLFGLVAFVAFMIFPAAVVLSGS